MLKRTIKYTDFNGTEREEDFFFNLSKSELMELEMKTKGGLEAKINRITADEDTEQIIEMFKDIILMSYGQKSEDGKRFIKTKEMQAEFVNTAAYDELFMSLVQNPEEAQRFIEGIIPKDAAEAAKAQQKPNPIPPGK